MAEARPLLAGGETDERDLGLDCSICLECLDDPYYLVPCNHSFCHQCILQHSQSRETKCPICRGNIQGYEKDDLMHSKLASCAFICSDCNNKIPALNMRRHRSVCAAKSCPSVTSSQISHEASGYVNRTTFTCPICDQRNLSNADLIQHCNEQHNHKIHKVVCPICVTMPHGDPNYQSNDFIGHLNLRHQFEYDTFIDFNMDFDQMEHLAMQNSLNDY